MKREEVFVNRELRWLSFNERVLQAAESPHIPLMERLKFIGIFSSNLDEFYSVRVGSLNRMVKDPDDHPPPPGVKPKRLIREILKRVQELNERVDKVFKEIIRGLRSNSIFFMDEENITPLQRDYVHRYFTSQVRSRLFPLMLDPERPFPYLKHVTLYLAIEMYRSESPDDLRYALIEVPTDVLPRYIRIPSKNNKTYYIILEDIIRLHLKEIFHIFSYDIFKAYTVKITRDAEYDLTEEVTKSLYEKLSQSIQQRKMGDPVRVVYDAEMPKKLYSYIMEKADFASCDNIIAGGRYHNARDMISFPRISREELYFPEQPPLPHKDLTTQRSIISQIEERDILLSFPYHRYGYMIDLLREAAIDPTVVSIKMTLYRVAEDSSVLSALQNAARNGKKVTVFIELQARFDEKHNMYWTQKLSREKNITLISGLEGFKVHSKIGVITRVRGKEKTRLALIGTGNFNESTAKLYSDHILMTAHREITREVNTVFKLLESSFYDARFKHLIVSPFYTRKKLHKMFKNEIKNVQQGGRGEIVIKLNNLVDEKFIKYLIKAAREGVKVRLMIRGIFSLTTAIKGVEEPNIEAKALIDRYLEHTRILTFHNNGNPRYFIGSADLMVRNLDKRIEVFTPVYDPRIKEELREYLDIHWADTYSSYSLQSTRFNQALHTGEKGEPRAQERLYQQLKNHLSEEQS